MDCKENFSLPAKIESVIHTADLIQRAPRDARIQEENEAFHDLARSLAAEPEEFLHRLVEVARRLCRADTVGVSVEETDAEGKRIFRWVAMAGDLKEMVGGTTPRNFSPCGVCVDTKQPLLMNDLDRAYPYFKEAPLPFVEALLIPWGIPDAPVGTLWVVAHNHQRKFDLQDVRIMSSLAGFACGAVYLQHKLRRAERDAASSRITSSMAHHINNPLQGAVLALYRLRTECDLNPDALELITILEAELRRVTLLSAELLRREVGIDFLDEKTA